MSNVFGFEQNKILLSNKNKRWVVVTVSDESPKSYEWMKNELLIFQKLIINKTKRQNIETQTGAERIEFVMWSAQTNQKKKQNTDRTI